MTRRAIAVALSILVSVAAAAQIQLDVRHLAGTTLGGGYVDAAGADARFSLPHGITTDDAGNIYVADDGNSAIRKISGNVVTTLAGNGVAGATDSRGHSAQFNHPNGIAFDRSTNTLAVADRENHTIRRVTLHGVVTAVAGLAGKSGSTNGTGSAARFAFPEGIAADNAGNIYVADTSNHLIRKIAPGNVVTTLAGVRGLSGAPDGVGSDARFNFPWGITNDAHPWVAHTTNREARGGAGGGGGAPGAGRGMPPAPTNPPAGAAPSRAGG